MEYEIRLVQNKTGTWSAFFEGEEIVSSKRDPETNACRAMSDKGFDGLAIFRHADGQLGLQMQIAIGAKMTVSENEKHGPRFQKWYPNDFF